MENALSEENRQQLISFRNCFVEHPVLTQVLAVLERLRNNQLLGGEQQCMLLTGDTGSGKSRVIQEYVSRFPDHVEGNAVFKPILVSRIPSRPDVEKMMIQLLSDLGQFGSDSRRERRREAGLAEALVHLLKKCGTQLIIINEFQELIEFKSIENRQRVANRLKLISEEAGVPIVLVGMPWAEEIAEEPQWASRLMCRIEIPYFKLSSNREVYIRFLKGLALRMGFSEPPDLAKQDIALPLFSACSGEVRKLKHILDEALHISLKIGANTVNKEHLADAFDALFFNKENPFLMPLQSIEIAEVSQYSRYNFNAVVKEESLVRTQFSKAFTLNQLLTKT